MFATINLIIETLNKLKVAKAKGIQSSEPSTGERPWYEQSKQLKGQKKLMPCYQVLSFYPYLHVSTWDLSGNVKYFG